MNLTTTAIERTFIHNGLCITVYLITSLYSVNLKTEKKQENTFSSLEILATSLKF